MNIYGGKIQKQRDGSFNVLYKGLPFNISPEYPRAEVYGEEWTFGYLQTYEKTHKDEFEEWVEPTPYEPSPEEKLMALRATIVQGVQRLLDETAQSRNYDNGFALASYATSKDAIFRHEAETFIDWRDKVWRYCYDLLDKYLQGEIAMLSVEEIMANMPQIDWEGAE